MRPARVPTDVAVARAPLCTRPPNNKHSKLNVAPVVLDPIQWVIFINAFREKVSLLLHCFPQDKGSQEHWTKTHQRNLQLLAARLSSLCAWYSEDSAPPRAHPLRVPKAPPPPSLMLPLFAYSDIFLALAEVLTHKSHLSNDIVKQASKCQHTALQSGDQRGEWGTPRWPLSSASSHLQVIWNQFPTQLGSLAR